MRAPDSAVISDVTFEPSKDTRFDGTLRLQLAGTSAADLTVQASNDDGKIDDRSTTIIASRDGSTRGDIAFEHWPADGRSVTLSLLRAPGAARTQRVVYRVPDRRPIAFRFAGQVPPALKLALLTVGVEASKNTGAKSVVFVAPSDALTDTPIPPEAAASILIAETGRAVSAGSPLRFAEISFTQGLALEGAAAADGVALENSGTPVLFAGPDVVAAETRSGTHHTLTLSNAIVGPLASLPRHAVFPVVLARLCDALVDRKESPVVLSASRAAADPLWPGSPASESANLSIVSDRPLVAMTATSTPPTSNNARGDRGWMWHWQDVVLAAALMLLLVESVLQVKKKIV